MSDFLFQGFPQNNSPVVDKEGMVTAFWSRFFNALWQRTGGGGAGDIVFGGKALATTGTQGFFNIPSMAGAPSGVPMTYPGQIPMVYNTANNRLYAYNGAWRSIGPFA